MGRIVSSMIRSTVAHVSLAALQANFRAIREAAARRGVRIGYHLKIDTGMNRLGFRHDNLRWTLPELLASSNLQLDAVYTHFATAEDAGRPMFNDQRVRFDAAIEVVKAL